MPIQRPNSRPGQPIATKPRRIVQIAVAYDASEEIEEDSLYALCDDGSVWRMVWEGDEDGDRSHWLRLANIPQD